MEMQSSHSLIPNLLYPGYRDNFPELTPQYGKSLIYILDPDSCRFPDVHPDLELGIFYCVFKLVPSNFRQLSYLNLDTCWYTINVQVHRNEPWTWQVQKNGLKGMFLHFIKETIFSAFEKDMFYKAKHLCISPFLSKYLKYCRLIKRFQSANEARRIYNTLVETIVQSACTDAKLVVDFLETVCESLSTKIHFFLGQNNAFYLDYLIFMAQKSKFNFWGLINDDDYNRFPFCPVLGGLFSGKEIHMDVLLNHGFQRIPPIYLNSHSTGLQSPIYLAYGITETLKQHGIEVHSYKIQCTENHLDRIFLVLEMVYVLCLTKIYGLNNFVNCMRLLWRAMPDHLLSYNEMVSVLISVARRGSSKALKALYESLAQFLDDIIVSVIEPRTLKHLSRCSVRKCLRKNRFLPIGICSLPLPEIIKSYLRLKF